MAFDLAKNRINILDIHPLHDTYYVVNFEYQYINRDKSRVWQKDVLVVNTTLDKITEVAYPVIVDLVNQARAELER